MIYLGGSWPEKYRDTLFMSNIHGNRLNNDKLVATLVSLGGDVLSAKELDKVASLPTRAQALSQLAWMNSTPHTTMTRFFFPERYAETPGARDERPSPRRCRARAHRDWSEDDFRDQMRIAVTEFAREGTRAPTCTGRSGRPATTDRSSRARNRVATVA